MRSASRFHHGPCRALFTTFLAIAGVAWAAPNYQGLWWNSPPGSESGWGINLAHQGDTIFATWFTYDLAGRGWWLSMTANRTAEGTYGGTLIESSGPSYDSIPFPASQVSRGAVGDGTLTFSDPDNGTFTYTVRGVRQAKSIARLAFGALPACSYEARPNLASAKNYQDLWWAAGGGESGWGLSLAHEGDTLFAAWFTYDRDGTPLWLSATAPRVGAGVYSGALVRTSGPAFAATPFDPAAVTRTVAGTVSLAFANGNAATFAYTLDGVTRTRMITRLLVAPPAGTLCREAAATVKGRVFDGYLERATVCADADGNGRCDAGEAQATTDANGAYELSPPAGFRGALVAEIVAGVSRDADSPGSTVDRAWRMASPSADYATTITPFTTLVHLTREADYRLAEEIVRNELGLPPGFALSYATPPAVGTLARSYQQAIVSALQATGGEIASPTALAQVLAALPASVTELPRLQITTKGGVPVVSKEDYVDATFVLTNPAAATPDAALNGKVRGRGNFTWMLPKKPYKVQFANDAAYARVADFLGMKKNRNWALLADYSDRTLMRNKLALNLGNSRLFSDGLKWTPSGQHVEVTLNGEYVGVYLMTEDIRIDPARLNIRKMSSSAAAADYLGGYIAEVDYPLDCYAGADANLQEVTPRGVHICVDTPDEESITADQLWFVKVYLESAEQDIHVRGDLSRINAASFADWYLVNELYRNYDAPFYSSAFMWKDHPSAAVPSDRVLNMGPLWDFDIGAGNYPFEDAWKPEGCWVNKSREGMPNWFIALFRSPEFLDLVRARWQERRPALERLVEASIASFARRLEAAQRRNFARWPVLEGIGNWTDRYQATTYAEHVAFLKGFLKQRMAWLDNAFASPEAFDALCR